MVFSYAANLLSVVARDMHRIDPAVGANLVGGGDGEMPVLLLDIDDETVFQVWIEYRKRVFSSPVFEWWSMLTKPVQRMTGEKTKFAENDGNISGAVQIRIMSDFTRELVDRAYEVLAKDRNEPGGFSIIERANALILVIVAMTEQAGSEEQKTLLLEMAFTLQARCFMVLKEVAPLYPDRIYVDPDSGLPALLLDDPEDDSF